MKSSAVTKRISFLLAALLTAGVFASCAKNPDSTEDTRQTDVTVAEAETDNPLKVEANRVLAELGEIDEGNQEFGILYVNSSKNELVAVNGTVSDDKSAGQVINDAVYERNQLFEERCHLKMAPIEKSLESIGESIRTEARAPTGDFTMINHRAMESTGLATERTLYNWMDMGIDVDHPWWEKGTAEFCLAGGIYLMTGATNYDDDNLTYVLIFNKDMQKQYENTVPNPYQTVKEGKWTLPYFNEIIQGISSDSSGDGKWDESDTYGFVSTWEYGNTFFIGCDLHYVINDRTMESPELYLSEKSRMERALNALNLSKQIYHNNHAMYMSPPGEELKGLGNFKDGRSMFYGEIAGYLRDLNSEMKTDYGILPVPKFDEKQEFYRTWTFPGAPCISITSAVTDDRAETIGKIVQAYAILSQLYVTPAYYDIMLTSRNVRDPESAEMLDLIFQNRIYDMAFYFPIFGFDQLFKQSVNGNDDKFSSSYTRVAKGFDRKLRSIMKKLEAHH